MTRKTDLLGRRFGSLLVVAAAQSIRGHAYWLCRCDCGRQSMVAAQYMIGGDTKSCGCLKAPFSGRHNTAMYRIWSGVISRCTSPGTSRYTYYGGRGIKVCPRWLVYENFVADMGERPPGMQLDRIDNDGDYEPSNCRWATRNEQQRNKRSSRILVVRGKRMTLVEASERFDIRAGTILKRLQLGWPDELAATAPLRGSVAA